MAIGTRFRGIEKSRESTIGEGIVATFLPLKEERNIEKE